MIVRLGGGLGNTMFQYAFGRSVSIARNEKLFFELKWFGKGETRAYSLDAFNVNVELADSTGHEEYKESVFAYDSGVYTAPNDLFYTGCWQTEKYFNEEIVRKEISLRKPISLQSQLVAERILWGPSAFVHVRRSDYLDPGVQTIHGGMGMDYYTKAMDYVRERKESVIFYIFSDDPEWCRVNFPTDIVVGHNGWGSGDTGPSTEHEDLALMALCQNGIIPNSTFGWWGAYLGDQQKDRIVVAPKNWFADKSIESKDIVPERWIKI